jgi:Cu(I)/Ag(I) efflux system membrane fusion protein
MAILRWGLVLLMAALALGSILYYFDKLPHAKASAVAAKYQCPMHPAVIQDQPGDCPICGMTLVLIQRGTGHGAHPGAAEGHAAHAKAGSSKPKVYACPMHPDQTSSDPKARCPICGMKLELRPTPPAKKPKTPSAEHSAHRVPGLVPIDLSAGRVQLTGTSTAKVSREELVPELHTVGFVSASERGLGAITTRYSGWIERLVVNQTGVHVSRGQLLATVYSPQLLSAQQEYLNALRWSKRAGAAAERGSPGLEQAARSRLELLGIAARELDAIAKSGEPLRALAIRSPIAGHIIQKSAIVGLYVQPGTTLFEVADLSTVWVLADVYEHELSRVRLGQAARLVLAAYPGQSFTGKVRFLSPTIDPSTRTLRVRIELPNRELKLRPGLYGDVILELGRSEGLVVPKEAVVDTGELQYLFVAKAGGRFEPRQVKLGARSEAKVQVLSGVEEGETVVTSSNFLIDSESRLRAAIEGQGRSSAVAHSGHAQ